MSIIFAKHVSKRDGISIDEVCDRWYESQVDFYLDIWKELYNSKPETSVYERFISLPGWAQRAELDRLCDIFKGEMIG